MHKLYIYEGLLVVWCLGMLSFGVSSLITGDSRFGRNMFHEQANYKVTYSLQYAEKEEVLSFYESDFLGKSNKKLSPSSWHQSRYGRGTAKHRIQSFLKEYHTKTGLSSEVIVLANVEYRINKGPSRFIELSYPHE